MTTELEIYGTLGPSCADVSTLRQMFAAGITGMRLNLSHGTLDDSSQMIEAFHRAADAEGVRPSLLIDMQGPELRIGKVKEGARVQEGESPAEDPMLLLSELMELTEPGRGRSASCS